MTINSMEQTIVTNPIWWKRRTALERGLMVIAIFGGFLCCTLTIAICVMMGTNFRSRNTTLTANKTGSTGFSIHLTGSSKTDENVCFSPACIHSASMVLKNMDPNVDPCDNFYKFACGGFIKSTVIPDDRLAVNSFGVLTDKLHDQLRTSIESKIESKAIRPFRLVKNLYNSCMNRTAIEAQGLKPLEKLLKKLGGWPVVVGDKWNDTDFDWISSSYKLYDAGCSFNYFFETIIDYDLKNSSKYVIYLDQAFLGLWRESLLEDFEHQKIQVYYNYMVDVAVILGADKERAETELKESLLLEMKLADIIVPIDNISKVYNPMRISELRKKYESIPWLEYFGRLLPSSIRIDDNDIVIVVAPSFMRRLENLMAITSKRVQANYLMWRTIKASIRYLSNNIRNREIKFYGGYKNYYRWRECLHMVSENLPLSLIAMYVRQYFTKEAKTTIEEMVKDIRKQLTIIISETEWLDEKTRQNALHKAAAMSNDIGYPDEILNDKELEKIYAKLELSDRNYFDNNLNLTIFQNKGSFGQLRTRVDKTKWSIPDKLTVVDAFYSSIQNRIIIPPGILQPPMFSIDRPRYMNYGAIGSVIGHENTHGFDNLGRQFDKDGNLVDWWSQKTSEEYLKRAQCIIEQYGNFTAKEVGLNIKGGQTLNENIADNGGFKHAYLAYNEWVNRNSPEAKLPGLPYTPRQMIWISAANMWCSNNRPTYIKRLIDSDLHSPNEFRILGSLSNIPQFSEDFNCPIGSKMNPKHKCSIW